MPKKILYVYCISHKELNKLLLKVLKGNVKDTASQVRTFMKILMEIGKDHCYLVLLLISKIYLLSLCHDILF